MPSTWLARSLLGTAALAWTGLAHAQTITAGDYLCTSIERAAIARIHLEGAGPPRARADERAPTGFKLKIEPTGKKADEHQVTELPYDGADRDRALWQDDNSVLHSVYVGSCSEFHALDGPAFLIFGRLRNGQYEFYHAGFEIAGGEDEQVAVRWGKCRKA